MQNSKTENSQKNHKLIVGLGNPGEKFQNNRHNIGASILFLMDGMIAAVNDKIGDKKETGTSVASIHEYNGKTLHLLFPLTYMNRSGIAIKEYMKQNDISLKDILVIYDAEEVKLGNYKVMENVSHRGHNGIRNIIDTLGSKEFKRVKVGIGSPPEGTTMLEFVLNNFTEEEMVLIDVENIVKDILESI